MHIHGRISIRSGIGTGLTSDCHRIGRIGNELALDRIDVGLALYWRQIGMDWHRIEIRLASDWNGLALDRCLIDIGLVPDCHWIGA